MSGGRRRLGFLTGAGQPLSVGAEFDRRHGLRVSGQRELHRVVWFGRVGLQTHHNMSKTRFIVEIQMQTGVKNKASPATR